MWSLPLVLCLLLWLLGAAGGIHLLHFAATSLKSDRLRNSKTAWSTCGLKPFNSILDLGLFAFLLTSDVRCVRWWLTNHLRSKQSKIKKQWRGFESGERIIIWKPWRGARSLETIRGRHCQDNLVCCCFFGGTFIHSQSWLGFFQHADHNNLGSKR